MHRQHIVMSDTPIEFSDHARAVLMSKGHVLIGGLGLGMVVQAVLDKPEVKHVQVIENSTDVINLIGPHYEQRYGHRLDIIEADLIKWLPKKAARYDMAWFDIWDGICSDNANEMKKLKRRFQQRCDWVGCWCYNETLRAR
jgi:spermidine synthase